MDKLLIIIILLCISACHTPSHPFKADRTIKFRHAQDVQVAAHVDSVQYLKLENVEAGFITHIQKVILKEDKIYMGDFRQHKIVVYDTNGNFKYSLDRKGRGPEEYLQIKSFAVNNSNLYILDAMKGTLQTYDNQTGKFISSQHMPIIAWDLEVLNNGGFVFAFSPFELGKLSSEQPNYKLFFTDKDLHITHKMFPYTEKEFDVIGKDCYFTANEESIIYHWCISDYFFVINKNNIDSIQTFEIDFGKQKIPQSLLQNKAVLDNEKYNYLYATPILNKDYIAFEVSENDYYIGYLYHIPTGKTLGNPTDNQFNAMIFPDACDNKGRFVYIIRNKETYDELVANGFSKATDNIEQHLEDGLVVMFY